jgi:aspartyl/glutamyl-tRNA(Asn/Gln) amidotransferase C subunit
MNQNQSSNIANLLKYAKMARLAPMDLTENDPRTEKYLSFFNEKDFNDVFEMINSDLGIDVSGIDENLLYFKDQNSLLRDDVEHMRNNKADILKNSKNTNGDYFITPKIIE